MSSQRPETPEADVREETPMERQANTQIGAETKAAELFGTIGLLFDTGVKVRINAKGGPSGSGSSTPTPA